MKKHWNNSSTRQQLVFFLKPLALIIAQNENNIVKLLLSANKVVSSDTRKANMAPFCIVLENFLTEEALKLIIHFNFYHFNKTSIFKFLYLLLFSVFPKKSDQNQHSLQFKQEVISRYGQ